MAIEHMGDAPAGWWVEEVQRGTKEVLIVNKGPEAKGTIEVDNIEEKTAWVSLVAQLNLTLPQL